MGKTILKWTILVALLAYAAVVCVWAAGEHRAQKCTGIDVRLIDDGPIDSLTHAGIMAEIGKFDPKLASRRLAAIDTHKLEQHLARFSNFENVQCVVTTHGRLRVLVTPIIPELRIFDGNESYYINKDGKRIPANAEFFVDVPIASGTFGPNLQPRDLLPVVRHIQRDSLLKNLITMVEARDRNNIMLIPCIRGHVINIGDTTRLSEKFANLLLMYRKVLPYRGWETYDTISVKFRDQIVASRRDKGPLLHSLPVVEEEDPEEATLPDIGAE